MLGQLVVPRQCNNEVLCSRCSLLLPGAPVATQLPDSFLWFAYIIMFASTMYIGNVLDLHTHDLVTYSVIPLTSDMTYSVTCHMTTHHMTYSVTWCTWSPDVQCSCMLCARYRDFCGVWDHRPLPPSLLCLLMSGVYPPHYTWSAFNIPQYYYAMLIQLWANDAWHRDVWEQGCVGILFAVFGWGCEPLLWEHEPSYHYVSD